MTDIDRPKLDKGLFVTGGEDGFAKVWGNNKELIREIRFPDSITTVCFLNSNCDILVGHGSKVSIILASDYKPFESIDLEDSSEDSKLNLSLVRKEIVSDRTFEKLKQKEDELKSELKTQTHPVKKKKKKKRHNQLEVDESFSCDEGASPEEKRKDVKFKGEHDISGISYSKQEESEEDLYSEEMFQKAYTATVLEALEKKK